MKKSTYHYSYKKQDMALLRRRRLLAVAITFGLFALAGIAFALRGWRPISLSEAAAAPLESGADLGAYAYDGIAPAHPSSAHTAAAVSAGGAPAAPSHLVATAVSDTEINLTWQRNSTNETGIVIQRSDDESTWHTVCTAPAGADIWTDTSLFESRAYHYRIAATNQAGTSQYTPPAAAVTLASASSGLRTPTNITATATSPTTATIAFDDPNSSIGNRDYAIERSDDGGLTYRVIGTCFYDNSGPYDDSLLTPGATYYYRIRGISTSMAPSPYTDPVTLTMPKRRAGMPIDPADTTVINNSDMVNTITWTDTNHGKATYVVERSPWGYTPAQFHFNPVGTIHVGSTGADPEQTVSFRDPSCSPESAYTYRVRAVNGYGSSGYDRQVNVTTASAGTGRPTVYNIGPGQTYPTIGSLDWRRLGPGDTVNIHGGVPYHELLLLTVRGTAAAPITIQGVPDSQGNYPIIDGTNAIQNSQFAYNFRVFGSIGCITTYMPMTSPKNGYRPGYLVIKNLELRNCYEGDKHGNTWTDYTGATRPYYSVGAGIYMLTGDNITIEGCNIHGNGEGVFGAGQSGYDRFMSNTTLRGNYIWGNGNINSFTEHNSYLESIGVLYEYNHYGPERAGALGSSLKDRSVGTVIRYNYIEASSRIIDLVEAQNEIDESLPLPAYHYAYVYGNILAQDDPRCANGIHYGGDQGMTGFYRKGILYLWNNTIVSTISQHDQWRSTVVQLSSSGESLDARNNIIAYRSLAGGNAPELDLVPSDGIAYFGVNWISKGWHSCFTAQHFTGVTAGTDQFITGTDPDFVSWQKQDYHLTAGSPCIGIAGPLSAAVARYSLAFEYQAPKTAFGIPGHSFRHDSRAQAALRIRVFHRTASGVPDLGVGASLNGKRVFPADNPWNQRVDNLPVDPNSDALIRRIGAGDPLHPDFGADWQGKPFGIPYLVVSGNTKPEPISFDYADQSDPGPYPIPPNASIEAADDPGADHHVLVIDRDHWKLYELFAAQRVGNGWHAGSGAIFDLKSNALRPAGWTSADAAGLPIFPGLARYDEVAGLGEIDHALRFTVRHTRRAYVYPARHFASRDPDPGLPPMGMRVRLKASVDISGFPPQSRVILQALKTYGMILADNGGNWFISGAPDSRWDDSDLNSLKRLHGSDFEVVKMPPPATD